MGSAVVRKLPPPRPPAPVDRRLLTLDEVADRLQVTRQTVRRLMLPRHGLRYIKVGRQFRFRPEWIDEFIERGGGSW